MTACSRFNGVLPVRTTVIDDHQIDVAGLSAVLGRFPDLVTLVAPDDPTVDVVLYGARELFAGHDSTLHALLRTSPATVIVMGWGSDGSQVASAVACGADGHLSKMMPGPDLAAGVIRINASRDRGRVLPHDSECHPALGTARLTPREQQVLELITLGLTNQEIADLTYLSINSVKTYVRSAYRKIGVTRRSQAVSWGLRAGFAHERDDREPEPAA